MKKVVLMMALAAFVLGGTVNAQQTKPAKEAQKETKAEHKTEKKEMKAEKKTEGKEAKAEKKEAKK